MRNKKIVMLSIVIFFALSGYLPAIEVLENGYKVESFASIDNPNTGAFVNMVFGDNANLYLSDGKSLIYKITPQGQVSIFASGYNFSGTDWGGGTEFGNFLFAVDHSSGFIQKCSPDGIISRFTSNYGLDFLTFDKTGYYGNLLYATTSGSDQIYQISKNGVVSAFSNFPGTKNGGGPFEIAFDTTGDYGHLMYMNLRFDGTYQSMSGVYSITTSGNATRFMSEISFPFKIDFDPTSNFGSKMFLLSILQSGQPCLSIWKVQPDGSRSDFAQTTASAIWDFTFSPDGSMYVLEYDKTLGKFIISKISKIPLVYHVDGSSGNNTNDGLSRQTAFQTIQLAIDKAIDGDTVLVWPGVYSESATNGINFKGKAIAVKSAADAAVLQVPGLTAVTFSLGEIADSVLSNFVIKGSNTAILALFSDPTLTNLTIVNNSNGIIADNSNPDISNCIFWNNTNGDIFGCSAKYSYVQSQLDDGLVAHWKLDGDASDSIGNNNGIIYGAVSTTGQVGSALRFDGIDDYISFPQLPITSAQFTISAWANHFGPGGGIGNENPIFSQRDDEDQSRCAVHLFTKYAPSGTACALIRSNCGDFNGSYFKYLRRDYNQWHHYAMTVDITNLIFYVDGMEVGRSPNTQIAGNYHTSIDYVDIGRLRFYSKDYGFFNGDIDDVRAYNRPLSSQEINNLYKVGLSGLDNSDPGFADSNNGDFHLLSQRGRYWPQIDKFVLDDFTSPCIDAGDPNIDPNSEPLPNGGRINIGAYGQTSFASMSESKLTGDLNFDHTVDYKDLAILAAQWLQKND